MSAQNMVLSIGRIEGYLLSLPNVPDPIWEAVEALISYHCQEPVIFKKNGYTTHP